MNNPLKQYVFYAVRLYGTKTEQVKAIWISFETRAALTSCRNFPVCRILISKCVIIHLLILIDGDCYVTQLLIYLSVNAFFPYPSRRLFTVVVSLICCEALVWKLPVQWAHIILVLIIGSESFESEWPPADPNSSGEVGRFLTRGCTERLHNTLFI